MGSRPVAILFWELGDTVVTDGITSSVTANNIDESLFDAGSRLRMLPNVSHHYKLVRCLAPAGQNQVHAEVRLVVYGEFVNNMMSFLNINNILSWTYMYTLYNFIYCRIFIRRAVP